MPRLGNTHTSLEVPTAAQQYMQQALAQGRPSSRCGSDSPAFLNFKRPSTTAGRYSRLGRPNFQRRELTLTRPTTSWARVDDDPPAARTSSQNMAMLLPALDRTPPSPSLVR